jgi:acetylornithine deacetylase/succinyl-diaminopimelate desuccinylase-like protein
MSISEETLTKSVSSQMPELVRELGELVAIETVSSYGFPEPHQPFDDAYAVTEQLFRAAGVENIEALRLPGAAPVLTGEIPGPEGAPTVLLYGHYDVVPAGQQAAWVSPPFEATERQDAIYGRGTADSKCHIVGHLAALRAWRGRPPVGVKILIEGMEEVGSSLEDPANLRPFAADAILVADGGNMRPGIPSLTVSLRGDASVIVEVRTLAGPKHSGQFGGVAPDALTTLIHVLASLHDEHGDVAVAGLRRNVWQGAEWPEAEFRELAEVEPGTPLFGTGPVADRMWRRSAITVTGVDAPSVDGAVNAVSAVARAKLNVRVNPEQDAAEAQAAVIRHLESQRPFGISVKVTAGSTGNGFAASTDGPAYAAFRGAMERAWGEGVVTIGNGASIPIVKALSEAAPQAEILIFGASDRFSNIHAANERVLADELEKTVLAETLFFGEYASRQQHGQVR